MSKTLSDFAHSPQVMRLSEAKSRAQLAELEAADDRLRGANARLAAEAAALKRLNEASSRLWQIHDLRGGLNEILQASIELLGADKGNVQLLDRTHGRLVIVAQRGFEQPFLEFFKEVSAEDDSACGRALRSGERIVIEDVRADEGFELFRPVALQAGFCAVQSTPLMARDGKPLGMLSTHFREAHRPDSA
jgi:GAF domain-containing protein